jgi:hypothetical protein
VRTLTWLLITVVSLFGVSAAGSAPVPQKTVVVRWSAFSPSGQLKASFRVKTVQGGCVDIGYSLIGGIGYRCNWSHYLSSTCFRDGPNPTVYAICVSDPWSQTVIRVRTRWLTYYPGVTYANDTGLPWALQLADGNRCLAILTGSSNIPTPDGSRRADFGCYRSGLELGDLRRDHGVWKISAVGGPKSGYSTPRFVTVRRAYFGALPPPMARQNALAGSALKTATRIIHRRKPKAHLDLVWIRLTLPKAKWAYVIFTPADASGHGYFALLHRIGNNWTDASKDTPYCSKLPRPVRHQLFLPRNARDVDESGSAPRGETRC